MTARQIDTLNRQLKRARAIGDHVAVVLLEQSLAHATALRMAA